MNDETDEKEVEEGEAESGTVVSETEEPGAPEDLGAADSPWGAGDAAGGEVTEAAGEDGPVNIDMIMDLPLQVVVELGRTKMLINDLLQIGQGSVIELNKQVGEPLDVLVNGKLVARGEVVVVKEKFGIRITDVISPLERIKQLGG